MEIKGSTIILEAGEEITIRAREKEEPQPEPTKDRISFYELVDMFNEVLRVTGHYPMVVGMDIYGHFEWLYGFAEKEFDNPDSEFFKEENYPEVFDYHGSDDSTLTDGYNAMQSWIFARLLVELCPTFSQKGEYTPINTQTSLYGLAWQIGGGMEFPLYAGHTFKADPYATRLAGSRIGDYTYGEELDPERIAIFRNELGGQTIPASCWEELGYVNRIVTDDTGWRMGYEMVQLGWLVNTSLIFPSSPAPRVEGTTVNDLPMPYEEGQPEEQFYDNGNYIDDDIINSCMVNHYNMMAQTPIETWNGYSTRKQNQLVNAAATNMCTYNYMFSKRKPVRLVLEDGDLPVVDGYRRFVFERCSDSPLAIEGPFHDLDGIFRYNVLPENYSLNEQTLFTVLDVSDNGRFPTQDPNYGRCRPGCACTREGGEKNPVHGAPENEIYNVSVACLVADTEEQRRKWATEDGFAADSPRSYISGHSAQITAMALLLGSMKPDRIHDYCRRAHEYSVNRTITRYHWNSDVIYGRLFGTMILPVIRAMEGLQDGFRSVKEWMDNPQPQPQGDYPCTIIIKNDTDAPIGSTGEIRLYVLDHIGIDANLPNWAGVGEQYTFEVGESAYSTSLLVHGDNVPPTEFDGDLVNEVRFYDERHWNNIDAGYSAELDTSDPRCTPDITKGGTYVIRITKI